MKYFKGFLRSVRTFLANSVFSCLSFLFLLLFTCIKKKILDFMLQQFELLYYCTPISTCKFLFYIMLFLLMAEMWYIISYVTYFFCYNKKGNSKKNYDNKYTHIPTYFIFFNILSIKYFIQGAWIHSTILKHKYNYLLIFEIIHFN